MLPQPELERECRHAATDTSSQPVYDLNTPLSELIEAAVGAEVSLFLPDRIQLGSACQACAAGPGGKSDAQRACRMVRELAAGKLVRPDRYPSVCEAGRAVRVSALESSNGYALVVAPIGGELESDLDQRLAATAALWERCERLASESEGLAQEVIRSYEQLNVIFDITQQICNSHDAAEIKHFLIRRLAQTLHCVWACCLSANEGMLWWSSDPNLNGEEIVAELRGRHSRLLWQVCEQRAPLVHNRGEVADPDEPYSLLIGALGEADATPDIMVLARGADEPEFIYGDVMMIDSMLSHAQYVVANLKLVERLRTMSLGAVRALVHAIDKKDHYTSGHSERVGFLSHLIGQRMGLSPEQLQDLEWGGLLHDVGKIGIREGILTKPSGLTAEEFDHIKEHVRMSYEIVAPIECMASVRDVVLYHHEVPDGTGYPKGLKGDEIPLLARIVHVADTFDALTTSRSYRKAFPLSKALAIMQSEKGTKLEAEIVDIFVEAFAAFRAE
ncbi:MAG TPA: HD-GYP domain-containing protein, partial [Phycisphaerae bacterium]|nr:HD-GYP domain-containing protein [Phycisphaerae bacterium]